MTCKKLNAANGKESVLYSKLLEVLGTHELASFEFAKIHSDKFREQFGNWTENTRSGFKDKSMALRQYDDGEPKLFKDRSQYYFKMSDESKIYINKIKFPEHTPDEIVEITSQLRYEFFERGNIRDLNNPSLIKLNQIVPSIEASMNEYLTDSNFSDEANVKAGLVLKYKEDFAQEIIDQMVDMGLKLKESKLKDENDNPIDELDEIEKDSGLNISANFTKNSKENATINTKMFLSQILDVETKVVEVDGKKVRQSTAIPGAYLGRPKFVEFDEVWSTLEPRLSNIVGYNVGSNVVDAYDVMINEINKLRTIKPWTIDLLNKLDNLPEKRKSQIQTEFFQAFTKARLNFYVTEFDKGGIYKVINASAVNSRSNKIKNFWGNNFKEEFIKGSKLKNQDKINNIYDSLRKTETSLNKAVAGKDEVAQSRAIISHIPDIIDSLNKLGVDATKKDLFILIKNVGEENAFREIDSIISGTQRVIDNILDPKVSFYVDGEFINPFDTQSAMKNLAEASALSAIDVSENTVVGNQGKSYWNYSTPSYLHNKINSWKQQMNLVDSSEGIDALSTLIYNSNSRWLKHLMASDIPNAKLRSEISKQRINEVDIAISSSFKSKMKDDGDDNKSINMVDAINDSITKILGEKTTAQKSLFPTIVPADKGRKFDIMGMPMIESKILYSDINGMLISDDIADIFVGYFEDEYNRMKVVANEIETLDEKDLIVHYHTGRTNGLKSQLFPELSPDKVKGDLKKLLYAGGKPLNNTLKGLDDSQREALRDYVKAILEQRIMTSMRELFDLGVISQEGSKLVSKSLNKQLLNKYKNFANPVYSLVGDYVVNGIVGNVEYMKLFSGDPAYYKDTNDLIKRIPATYTDGLQLRLETEDHMYFNTAVIDGVEVASRYLDLIKKSVKDKSIVNAYKRVNTTDAQAWITPNRWRFLMKRLGKWSPLHDKVFEKMINGKKLHPRELKHVLQPLKGVYFDINDGRPVYLKYSQSVLIPGMVKGTPMEKLLDKMTKDNEGNLLEAKDEIHEVITIDGVKVGAKGVTQIHKEGTTDLMDDFTLNKNVLSNRGWKLQQDLPTKLMHDTLLGSQIQKTILSDLALDKDYIFDGDKIKGSEILQEIHDTIRALSNKGKETLTEKFDIRDGKINNLDRVYSALIDEFKSRGADENIIAALEKGMAFDAIPQARDKVQNIFMAIMNKELVRLETNGGAFIQVSPFGNESVSEDTQIKIVSKNYDGKGLKPPRIEKGKVMPGQCFIPHSEAVKLIPENIDWTNMTTDELLEIINPSALQLVGYRIPNQGMSSNDALEIVGILPPEIGDSIMMYDGIPAKTGSDFDIDKMYIMMHNLEWKDGKLQKMSTKGDSKKALQNKVVDLYTSILTSPHTYDNMMRSIDTDFFKDDITNLFPEDDLGDMQMFSPIQQIKTKFEYMSGKFGVAQTANQLVDHVLNQTQDIAIDLDKFPLAHTNGKFTKMDEIKDINGKYNISDTLSAFLNAYVDIAKDPYISRGNHNSITSGTVFMLIRAGVPIEWVNRFIGQPILKEYVELTKMSEGKTSDGLFVGKNKVDADTYLRDKYQFEFKPFSAEHFNPSSTKLERLAKMKSIEDMNDKDKAFQLEVLNAFKYFLKKSKPFNDSVNASKSDVTGGGGNMIHRYIQEAKTDRVINDGNVLGFEEKFIDTMLGAYHDNSVKWVGDVVNNSDIFISGKKEVNWAYDEIYQSSQGKPLADVQVGRTIDSGYYNYLMSNAEIFKNNKDNFQKIFVELPTKIRGLKKVTNNFLIQELSIKESQGYNFLGLSSNRRTKTFNNRMYRAWDQLLRNDDKNIRDIGYDLVRYAFMQSGFKNNLNQFYTHIPHYVFNDMNVNNLFSEAETAMYDGDFKEQFKRHSAEDTKIVPRVSNKNTTQINPKVSRSTGFVYLPSSSNNNISIGKNIDGDPIYPDYISTRTKVSEDSDRKVTNLYRLFGGKYVVNKNGKKEFRPIYLRTFKLGLTTSKGKIFEYEYDTQVRKSLVSSNNLPKYVSDGVQKLLVSLPKETDFVSIKDYDVVDDNKDLIKSNKIIDDRDVQEFLNYIKKSGNENPENFFTHNTVYAEFFNENTGKREKMPQDHLWIINDNKLYDMIDVSSSEIVIPDTDLRDGYRYVNSSDLNAVKDNIDQMKDDNNLKNNCE